MVRSAKGQTAGEGGGGCERERGPEKLGYRERRENTDEAARVRADVLILTKDSRWKGEKVTEEAANCRHDSSSA